LPGLRVARLVLSARFVVVACPAASAASVVAALSALARETAVLGAGALILSQLGVADSLAAARTAAILRAGAASLACLADGISTLGHVDIGQLPAALAVQPGVVGTDVWASRTAGVRVGTSVGAAIAVGVGVGTDADTGIAAGIRVGVRVGVLIAADAVDTKRGGALHCRRFDAGFCARAVGPRRTVRFCPRVSRCGLEVIVAREATLHGGGSEEKGRKREQNRRDRRTRDPHSSSPETHIPRHAHALRASPDSTTLFGALQGGSMSPDRPLDAGGRERILGRAIGVRDFLLKPPAPERM